MYRESEHQINEGLSPTARYILAFFSGLFGVAMWAMASKSDSPLGFFAFGAFCNLIALACVTQGRVRQFIGSVIGLSIFLFSLAYLYSQATTGPINSGSRSQPSLVNSLFFLIAFGVPGLVYVIKAKFGWRSHGSK